MMSEIYEFECNELEEMLIVNYQEGFSYNMSYEDDVYSVAVKLNEQQATITELNDKLEKSSAFIIEQRKENRELRKELDNFKPVMFQDVRKGTVILYSKGD